MSYKRAQCKIPRWNIFVPWIVINLSIAVTGGRTQLPLLLRTWYVAVIHAREEVSARTCVLSCAIRHAIAVVGRSYRIDT